MRFLLASLLFTALPLAAQAQSASRPGTVPAKAAKKPAAAITKATLPVAAAPLSEAALAVARDVHVGDIHCELGNTVSVKALPEQPGYFEVAMKQHRFQMHPVVTSTGAVRLEAVDGGALWLQLGNKSMLMHQKLGQRLADECKSAAQAEFARTMKPVNLLEPAPQVPATATTAPVAAQPQLQAAPLAALPAAEATPHSPAQLPAPVPEPTGPR